MIRAGAAWRMMPHDLPPWAAVYQQNQRWFKTGVFEASADDLQAVLRLAEQDEQQKQQQPFSTVERCNQRESGEQAFLQRWQTQKR